MKAKAPAAQRTATPAAVPAADWRGAAGVAARLLAAAILLFSGLHKAAAPVEEFMAVLEGYMILPESQLEFFATVMPWAEVFAGFFLLFGLWTRAAAVTTIVLAMMFFTALLVTKIRGLELANCGCFGTSIHLERWQAMTLDVALLALGAAAYVYGRRLLSLDNWVEAAPRG